jgi:hypothetical protein
MRSINTVVPVPIDYIKEYFKDKTLMFFLNYNESKLQDKVFLTYLSNLDVPCDLDPALTLTKEQKFKLVESYMDMKNICDVPTLNMAMIELVLAYTGIDPSFLLSRKFFTQEELIEFITLNQEKLNNWIVFLDSTQVFLLKSFQDLNQELKVETAYECIDDPHYVGLNVVNMFSVPGFLEIYFSSPRKYFMNYFKQQFENHMFKGKSLYDYYVNDNNMFVPLLTALIEEKLPMNPNEILKVK